MKKTITYSAVIALSLGFCSLSLTGCGEPSESTTSSPSDSDDHDDHDDHEDHAEGDHDHADDDHGDDTGMTDMEKMKVELAKLSPEDAASAEKQHVCLVSGDMLGAMGAPIKIDVEGQEVWICCEGCRDPLLEDPAKYLAKLEK